MNPGTPLNLAECVQPVKQLFLDENEFPSSDLFNVTSRVKNIGLRIPAAILDDVRSCDITMELKETMLTISSALPRTFLSGKIGNSVYGEDATVPGLIDFPNDPSDVAYVLERSEDPSNRQRGIRTSKAISTFRVQLTLRGAAVRLIPIVPFGVAEEAKNLLAPIELTTIICFEGEPPSSSDSNQTKVVLFTSVQIHRLDVNLDLELATSAIGTLVHHGKVVKGTLAACAKFLKDLQLGVTDKSDPSETSTDGNTECSSTTEGKIEKSFSGRKILVRRQIHQSRETGGASVAFCFQVQGVSFTLWRQNVPYNSYLRSKCLGQTEPSPDQRAFVPILKLLHVDMKESEFGFEATFRRQRRRVVLKAILSSMEVSTCDFAKILADERFWTREDSSKVTQGESPNWAEHNLVPLFGVGHGSGLQPLSGPSAGGNDAGFALRLEEDKDVKRSWSVGFDVGNGAVVCCDMQALEAVALLVYESLLLPAWTKTDVLASEGSKVSAVFPPGSIGALFAAMVRSGLELASMDTLTADSFSLPFKPGRARGGMIDQALRSLIENVLPKDIGLILVRVSCVDALVQVPVAASPSRHFGLIADCLDFLVCYVATDEMSLDSLWGTLGRQGMSWLEIVMNKDKGLRHSMNSRLRVVSCEKDTSPSVMSLVDPFECGYKYANAKAFLEMQENISVVNLEKIDEFLLCLKNFAGHTKAFISTIKFLTSSGGRSRHKNGPQDGDDKALELACLGAASAIRSARQSLRVASDELAGNHDRFDRILRQKDGELLAMKRILFEKEKERLTALALVSSQATGWLRIGSSQRIGQRGMMSWNLWPRWSILRRSLLLIYSGPSEVSCCRGVGFGYVPCPFSHTIVANTTGSNQYRRLVIERACWGSSEKGFEACFCYCGAIWGSPSRGGRN